MKNLGNDTKIAKEFRFEMSHRLPYHKGECRNIHGHSYKLLVELSGTTNEQGMLLDYFDLFDIVKPVIKQLDHSFICDENDEMMLEFLKKESFKHVVIQNFTTAENLSLYIMKKLAPGFNKFNNIKRLKVCLFETEDVYAESETAL